jgi:competence protein ComEA
MFGRRSSGDSDLADVAQRRLAVLARQLEQARTGAPRRDNHPADGATDARDDDAASAGPDPDPSRGGRGGRHVRAVPPRWWLTPPQVTVIALLVMAALLVVAWWVLRSVPDTEPVQLTSERRLPPGAPTDPVAGAPSVSTPADGAPVSTPPGDGVPGPTPSADHVLVVDVAGKVRRPGIVELPAGSRVVDALQAAGGARPRVDTSGLNLARMLVDGE